MFMVKNFKTTVLAAIVAAGMVASAQAATIANKGNANDVDGAFGTVVKGGVLTGFSSIQSDSFGGQYRTPFEGTSQASSSYFNILGGGTATLTTGVVRTFLTFLWGSPDSYNSVELFLAGASQGKFFGNEIPQPVSAGGGAAKVRISGLQFDSVAFNTTGNSFELSNISAVPLPAGGLLLLSGLGGIAALRRRRKA